MTVKELIKRLEALDAPEALIFVDVMRFGDVVQSGLQITRVEREDNFEISHVVEFTIEK